MISDLGWSATFGDKEYTYAFETFVTGSVEKIKTAIALGQLISDVHACSRDNVHNTPPVILDIGAHDGTTLHNVLLRTSGIGTVRIYGLDYKPNAASAFKQLFCTISERSEPRIENVASAVGNAFSGGIGEGFDLEKRSVDYALISHLLYGVTSSDVKTLLNDITGNLLSDRGVAIFVHVSQAGSALPAMRNKYGSRAERDVASTANKVRCAPTAIKTAMEFENYELMSVAYTVRTYFEKMSDAEWDTVEASTDFERLSDKDYVARNIARIAFIALRSPIAMAREEQTWTALAQEVRMLVQNTETDSQGGYLEDNVVLQLLFRSEPTVFYQGRSEVERAVHELSKAMPEICEMADSEFLSRQN